MPANPSRKPSPHPHPRKPAPPSLESGRSQSPQPSPHPSRSEPPQPWSASLRGRAHSRSPPPPSASGVIAFTSAINSAAGSVRMTRIQPIHIRQQDQQIGIHLRHHQRRQFVVIAKHPVARPLQARASPSRSPGLSNSIVETVSFSLITGTIPSFSSVSSVARRFE